MKKLLLTLAMILLLVFDLNAKETVTWQVVHWPPYQMLDGPDQGQGLFDALLDLFKANLPQYEHKTIEMNWARFFSELKEGKKICSLFTIKTEEREAFIEFSKPVAIGTPLRIMMRESGIETLGSRDPISMVTLLKDTRFKGVLIDKRSYYPVMDKIFEEHASLTTFKKLAIPEQSVIQMILAGRADYTLEYPNVANYMAAKFQDEFETKIRSIPVKELQELSQSSCACPKNEWGKQVIKEFDIMLDQVKQTPEYLKIMQMYQTDPKELEKIRQGFEKIIIQTN